MKVAVQGRPQVGPVLLDRQPHQRLDAGQEHPARFAFVACGA